jgi:hypothetical protein
VRHTFWNEDSVSLEQLVVLLFVKELDMALTYEEDFLRVRMADVDVAALPWL